MNNFDLHMHSGYSSDGQFTPQEIVDMAYSKGLKYIALTDHDLVKGVQEMIDAAKPLGITVIPGVECSTLFEGENVHVLGLGIDIHNEYFVNLSSYTKKLSRDAFSTRVQKLVDKYGVEIDEQQILEETKGRNPWFLMMTRLFEDPRYQDIPDFKDYIKGGKRSDPAPVNFFWDKCQPGSDLYVHVPNPDFVDTIKKIHEAGGIAIIAHPFRTFYQNEEFLQKAIDAGIDGIEAYSNYHEAIHNEYYENYANEHGLLITCGSDFHGEKKPSIELGEYGLHHDGQKYLDQLLHVLKG